MEKGAGGPAKHTSWGSRGESRACEVDFLIGSDGIIEVRKM